MQKIILIAPAKINTHLTILGCFDNGFHDLEMVMVPLSLHDQVDLSLQDSQITFELIGNGDMGMQGDSNLAVRAAKLMAMQFNISTGVHIRLHKRIPIAAGLGGGSSDAAAVMRGLNELWHLNQTPAQLAALGAGLGADIPFFFYDSACLVKGIGDQVFPYDSFPKFPILLINPGFAVSTPWAFKQWDLQLTMPKKGDRLPKSFSGLQSIIRCLSNDLESITMMKYPELATIKQSLKTSGAIGIMMSGSGPTFFGIYNDVAMRDCAKKEIECDNSWHVFATST